MAKTFLKNIYQYYYCLQLNVSKCCIGFNTQSVQTTNGDQTLYS